MWIEQFGYGSIRFGLTVCQREMYENSSVQSRQTVIPRFITHYALADDISLRESHFANECAFREHESESKQTEVNRLQYVNVEKIKLNQDNSVVMCTDLLYLKRHLLCQEY